jgi:hypothetical protein
LTLNNGVSPKLFQFELNIVVPGFAAGNAAKQVETAIGLTLI